MIFAFIIARLHYRFGKRYSATENKAGVSLLIGLFWLPVYLTILISWVFVYVVAPALSLIRAVCERAIRWRNQEQK